MVAPVNIALLLTFTIGAVLAAPKLPERGNTFSVAAVHNDRYVRNGPAALRKAYAKYGLNSSRPNTPLRKRQDGSVPAAPAPGDSEYLCQVSIGGQILNLDFDTGSSDLWVFSTLLPESDKKGHKVYDSKKSDTSGDLPGYTWIIEYGDGSAAAGIVGTDTVLVGTTLVEKQAVELAEVVSTSFISDSSDGILGLAFRALNRVMPTPQATFFENALKTLKSPLFAAYLPQNETGAYDFGATDSSKFSGDIKFAPVDNSQGFWQVNSSSYKVGDKKFSADGVSGILDTGTTLLIMNDYQVKQYYSTVSGARDDAAIGGWVIPCDAKLPTLSFLIGDTESATIPSNLLNFGPVEANSPECFGALQSSGPSSPSEPQVNIYGDIFFNAYYGVFDNSLPQFGFAPST